jgi:hypothetical protein
LRESVTPSQVRDMKFQNFPRFQPTSQRLATPLQTLETYIKRPRDHSDSN